MEKFVITFVANWLQTGKTTKMRQQIQLKVIQERSHNPKTLNLSTKTANGGKSKKFHL